jgi:hypothetical protein
MTDEQSAKRAHARVYLDGQKEPMAEHPLPARIQLDTAALADGPHTLTVRATDDNGQVSVLEIPFKVRNGPGLSVTGLAPNSTRHGVVELGINAFSADEPFEPQRAETRSSIPVWVWVMALGVVAWAAWYGASMWKVPENYANTPTYSVQGQTAPKPANP